MYKMSLFVLVMLSVGTASCMFHRLKDDVEKLDDRWEVYSEVTMPDDLEGQLLAMVYIPREDEHEIAAFRVVDPSVKIVAIFLNPGTYRFALVHDKNKNLVVDEGEPVYLHNHGHRLKFSDVVKRIDLKLEVPETGTLPKKYQRDLNTLPASAEGSFHLAFGETLKLDDDRFSAEAGKLGLWEPALFLEKYGAGIYCLKPYDPDRIPVVFVSGAGGSAQEWRYFFERLDKEKFQAWFWLYPSGMRISYLGHNLNRWIEEMARLYPIDRIYLVAHSMGGLVSRDGVVRHLERAQADDKYPVLIKKFITISTPWNGHKLAKKGVENLSVPIPSWHDIIPGSLFLQTVFKTPLKPEIDHHLIFGYTADSGDDGTVALSSLLLKEAQNDAVEVRGFEADHVGILFEDEVFEHVQDILYRSEDALAVSPKPATLDTPTEMTDRNESE